MRYSLRHVAACAVLLTFGFQSSIVLGSSSVSRLDGRIYAEDGESPLADAEVVAYNLSTEMLYRSTPTDDSGRYRVADLPPGYYDIAIQTEEGLFVADRPVRVPEQGAASVSLAVGGPGATHGGELPATGKVDSLLWSSLVGALGGPAIGTAVVVGGLALSAVVVGSALSSDNSTNSASPFSPLDD